MTARDELVATILRVIQRTADAQGNVTMIRLAGAVAEAVTNRYTSDDADPIGPDGFTRLAPALTEVQHNALEMARKAYIAERRAEEAEFHVEQLRDALDSAERIGERAAELATERDAALARIARTERLIDSWEHDAPEHSNPVFIGRLRECLRRDPAPVRLRAGECGHEHEWVNDSGVRECLICGAAMSRD